MSRVLILYSTIEGQTGRIAERIAEVLRSHGHVVDQSPTDKASFAPSDYDGVVVGASIHYGRHARHLRSLLRRYRNALSTMPSAFFSVSLSAGGPGAKPEAARRYMDDFLDKVGWHPEQSATFAGALLYREYGFLKRLMMRAIVGTAGGDTDTSRNYEYTDWNAVERYAELFSQRLKSD